MIVRKEIEDTFRHYADVVGMAANYNLGIAAAILTAIELAP